MKPVETVIHVNFKNAPKGQITRYQFEIAADGLGYPIYIPVLVAQGQQEGPIFGLTAVVHGNELNGLAIIQRVMREINIQGLKGTVVGIPVVNVPGFVREQREFNDGYDLNRVMPGKENGTRSEIYSHRIFSRIISQCNYLIDLHTASFGRVNSFYTRADMSNPTIARLAKLLQPDIMLHNIAPLSTLRGAAQAKGIATVTAELRDPYKFQEKVIDDATAGIKRILEDLGMQPHKTALQNEDTSIECERSYWIHTTQGGLLSVIPSLLTKIKKGDIIARVQNIFGDVIVEYHAPEDGIVIGKSINPVNQTGSRILHLGIIKEEKENKK